MIWGACGSHWSLVPFKRVNESFKVIIFQPDKTRNDSSLAEDRKNKILIKKEILLKCLMDFCSVLNGICSTLKSDNERFFPVFFLLWSPATEHKWWTEVKFMCQVENISEYKGRDGEKSFNLYFIVFWPFIYFPFSLLIHHNGVFFARRWKNYAVADIACLGESS